MASPRARTAKVAFIPVSRRSLQELENLILEEEEGSDPEQEWLPRHYVSWPSFWLWCQRSLSVWTVSRPNQISPAPPGFSPPRAQAPQGEPTPTLHPRHEEEARWTQGGREGVKQLTSALPPAGSRTRTALPTLHKGPPAAVSSGTVSACVVSSPLTQLAKAALGKVWVFVVSNQTHIATLCAPELCIPA